MPNRTYDRIVVKLEIDYRNTMILVIGTFFQDVQQDKDNDFTGFDIPIFTEEFLDHNKGKKLQCVTLNKIINTAS